MLFVSRVATGITRWEGWTLHREQSLPLQQAKTRKRYAKLPRGPWVDAAMDTWCGACSSHYALLLLEAEVNRGGMVTLGKWRGAYYAALIAPPTHQAKGPNAVSAWAAPSPITALRRLAFRWSVLMGHSFDPDAWLDGLDPVEMMMPVGEGDACQK